MCKVHPPPEVRRTLLQAVLRRVVDCGANSFRLKRRVFEKAAKIEAKMNIFNDLRSYSRHWIKEFIETYKGEVCLWQTKHPDYNNHILRNQAYEKLTEKLKEVESNPDRSMVVRKINSLRSAFRREYRKKTMRKNYVPRLWYYDYLSFIAQQYQNQKPRRKANTVVQKSLVSEELSAAQKLEQELDQDDTDVSQYDVLEEEEVDLGENKNIKLLQVTLPGASETQQAVASMEMPAQSSHPTISTHSIQVQKDFLETATTSPHPEKDQQVKTLSFYKPDCIPILNSTGFKHDDEFDAIGMNVASKLRGMNQTQRIIAEKLISDVLFSAQLDGLTVSSRLSL